MGDWRSRARIRRIGVLLSSARLSDWRCEILGVAALCPILLSAALWNGFPVIFFDTGAYLLQGLAHIFIAERSSVYSQFLRYAGGGDSLWWPALVQCLIVAFAMCELARALRPELPLWFLLAVGALLALVTGLPWYAAQIEPDAFAAVSAVALYLLAFHGSVLGVVRKTLLVAVAGIAGAAHLSHLGVAVGLLLVLAGSRIFARMRQRTDIPRPALLLPAASCALALAIVLSANYAFTRQIFVSRAGAVFLAARMMQDGLIKPVLDAECPRAGYWMCPYKDRLPSRADTWLWDEKVSPFAWRGFGVKEAESARLAGESVRRMPVLNLGWAAADTVLQFFAVATGDGIEPQQSVNAPEFRRVIPEQMGSYLRARQQKGDLPFLALNVIHVPVAILSLAALAFVLRRALRRRRWNDAVLAAFVLLALLGNAVICGVFSGPHFRYQSRLVWIAPFVLAMRWRGLSAGRAEDDDQHN